MASWTTCYCSKHDAGNTLLPGWGWDYPGKAVCRIFKAQGQQQQYWGPGSASFKPQVTLEEVQLRCHHCCYNPQPLSYFCPFQSNCVWATNGGARVLLICLWKHFFKGDVPPQLSEDLKEYLKLTIQNSPMALLHEFATANQIDAALKVSTVSYLLNHNPDNYTGKEPKSCQSICQLCQSKCSSNWPSTVDVLSPTHFFCMPKLCICWMTLQLFQTHPHQALQ